MDKYTSPHWDRSALLIIDVQRDFSVPGAGLYIEGTEEVVPRIAALLSTFRSVNRPIIHVVRLYLPDGSNVDLCRRARVEAGDKLAEPGTDAAQIVKELLPEPSARLDSEVLLSGGFQEIGPNEWIMYKPRWSAFHGTTLSDYLTEMGVDTVVLCGCNFPNCPRTTVYGATAHDFRVAFVQDAVSGVYEKGLEELRGIGVMTVDSDECIKLLKE